MAGLVVLALRRTLPPWLIALLCALLFLAARGAAHAPPLDERAAAELRALARANVWSVLVVLAPILFLQAARLGRGAEKRWLLATPAPRLALSAALVLGCVLAAAGSTLLTAAIGETATESTGVAWRRARRAAESPPAVLIDAAPAVEWSLAAPAPHARMRLWTTVAPGSGPAVTARFTARADERVASVEARVSGRIALELVPPAASGALELRLERVGTGALLVLPHDALEILEPVRSERLAALALGLRAFLLLGAGAALALGLGSVMRPALAAGLVLALALCACRAGSVRGGIVERWAPAADISQAWRELATGLVPAGAPAGTIAGALAVAALGLVLHARASAGEDAA